MKKIKNILEKIYKEYNKKEYITPDPLQFLHEYKEFYDIEIVALISSSLAYGRVETILKNIKIILNTMNKPYQYIMSAPEKKIINDFKNFKHRFTSGKELSNLLISIKKIYENYDSIYNCFKEEYKKDKKLTNSLVEFVKYFKNSKTLIPDVSKGSSCKRLFLFLRWLIREDEVDIGIWKDFSPSKLIIPLDTHMLNISKMLNFTKKKSGNLKTAIEVTENFRKINKDDPVKYDFALTRFGIRSELSISSLHF